MIIETTTRNMNTNCKQIQKYFNVVDGVGVIKHNLCSILENLKEHLKKYQQE